MADKKVSFKIELTGMSQLRSSMKSVTDFSKQQNLAMQHDYERHSLKIAQIRKKLAAVEKDVSEKGVRQHKSALQQMEREEERFSLRRKQMAERFSAQGSGGGGFGLAGLGHLAQVGGFYKAGHLLRAAGSLSMGGAMGGASMIGGVALAGTALAGLAITTKILESGFAVAKETIGSFISAVSQIGGARGLQDMITESVSKERLSANIAANTTDKMTGGEISAMITSLSRGSEFKPEEIAQGLRAFVGKTGEAKMFGQLGGFATQLSSVSGLSMQETGTLLGGLRAQFGLSPEQLKNVSTSLWMQGKAGTVELKDATSISQALGFSRMAGRGDIQTGIAAEMGAVQMAQKGLGGSNAEEAVTAVRRLQEEMQMHSALLQSKIGGGAVTQTDKSGNVIFTNFAATLSRMALVQLQHPQNLKGIDERALRLTRGIGEYAAGTSEFKGSKTDEAKRKVIEDIFTQFAEGKYAFDELTKSLKDISQTTDYQLKQSFNNLAAQLETGLEPIIKEQVIPAVQEFSSILIENKDQLAGAISDVINIFEDLAKILPDLALGFVAFAQVVTPGNTPKLDNLARHIVEAQQNIEERTLHKKDLSDIGASQSDIEALAKVMVVQKYPSMKDTSFKPNQEDIQEAMQLWAGSPDTARKMLGDAAETFSGSVSEFKKAVEDLNKHNIPGVDPNGRETWKGVPYW